MEPATIINPVTFTVEEKVTKNPVSGVVTYDIPTVSATFTPTAPLLPNIEYNARISEEVAADLAGNLLGGGVDAFTWRFTTGS